MKKNLKKAGVLALSSTLLFNGLIVGQASANSVNLIKNPSFEELEGQDNRDAIGWHMNGGANGWTSGAEAITGSRYAWTQPGKEIYQDVVIPVTGMYKLSANARAKGNSAKLGIRKKDGTIIAETTVPYKNSMHGTRDEIAAIYLKQGDEVQVFYGNGDSWSHVEDIELLRDDTQVTDLVLNGTFESGPQHWTVDPTVETVTSSVYLPTGTSIRQNVKIPMKGPYILEAEVISGAGSLGVKKNGTELGITPFDGAGSTLLNVNADANDNLEVYVTSTNDAKLTNVSLQFDKEHYVNTPPEVSAVSIQGAPWTDEGLTGSYVYSDPDGHREGSTSARWLISDKIDGEYTPIEGETNNVIETNESHLGKYLKFEVTPRDNFGQTGKPVLSSAIGPIEQGLLENSSFYHEKTGWVYDGAFTYKNGKNGIAYLDPNPNGYLYQVFKVPQSGYYKLSSLIKKADAEAKYGIRLANGGSIISEGVLPQTTSPTVYKLGEVYLEQNQTIEIFYNSINQNKAYVEIDSVCLSKTADADEVKANILSFQADHQIGLPTIDLQNNKVTFHVKNGTDVSKLATQISVSKGATLSGGGNQVTDFTQPVTYTVTDTNGTEKRWTVEAIVENKDIMIESSNSKIKDTFDWAKTKARSYVRTGKSGLINRDETGRNTPEIKPFMPSYWAGYAHRYAFYGRDFAHQATGAEILGLTEENFNMLKSFAGTASEESKWYPAWAINFDGSIFKLDYNNVNSFVREVPAVFELVEKAYSMYQWTGDNRYITDPVLWNYYEKALNEFITYHDTQIPNGVAEGTGKGIFDGVASYNERSGEAILEAGDSIGSQYQATLAYSKLLEMKGEKDKAAEFAKKAQDLKTYFNTEWGIKDGEGYVRGYEKDTYHTNFSKEASWFMPMKQITEPGTRTDQFLSLIDQMCENPDEAPVNIEAFTYLPDVFFPYGKNETAWKWMKYVIDRKDQPHEFREQGTNGDYPEVSFTLISQTVEGLMGVTPNAPKNTVTTLSRLPQDIKWLELKHVVVGDHDLDVKHEGTTKTTFKNNSGNSSITWKASFQGDYAFVSVDGTSKKALHETINGVKTSYVVVDVPVGSKVNAEVTNTETPVQPGKDGNSSGIGNTNQGTSGNTTVSSTLVTLKDGTYIVDAAKLNNQLKDKSSVVVEVKNDTKVVVQVPTKPILAHEGRTVTIQCGDVYYHIDSKALAPYADQAYVNVTIDKSPVKEIDQLASKLGITVVGTYAFKTDIQQSYTARVLPPLKSDEVIVRYSKAGQFEFVGYSKGSMISDQGDAIYCVIKTKLSFSDLKSHWAQNSIFNLANRGLVKGMTETTFVPNGTIKRSELMSMLVRAMNLQGSAADFTLPYTDVKSDQWFYDDVKAATKAGLVKGTAENKFVPDADVTREEAAVMFQRALALMNEKSETADHGKLDAYKDHSNISDWAKNSVTQSVSQGLIQGTEKSEIKPKADLTRAEAAAMLERMLKKVDKM